MIQRGGQVLLRMLANVQQAMIKPVIEATVAKGSLIDTDEDNVYARLPTSAGSPNRSSPRPASSRDRKSTRLNSSH